MELHRIRSGTKEALESKQYTIGVGISLGNKWFTINNILGLIRWSLPYTREKIVVYVADTIHAVNIEVRDRKSKARALVLAHQMGNKILNEVKNAVKKTFSLEERQKLIYATWDDLVTEKYKEKVNYLYHLYKTEPEFESHITSIIKNGVSKEAKTFSKDEVNLLGSYILEELPEVLVRVPIKGILVDAFAYPYGGEIAEFVEKIQQGMSFPEIKTNILDTEPKVFLEVR